MLSLEKIVNHWRGLILAGIGLLQLVGVVLCSPTVRGIGLATCASPAPKVFAVAKGLETFSTDFTLAWKDTAGVQHTLALTPEIYSKVRGPYNRRNVYGAMLAYGPVLSTQPETQALFSSICDYALTGKAPLLCELNIDPETIAGPISITLHPKALCSNPQLPMALEVTR